MVARHAVPLGDIAAGEDPRDGSLLVLVHHDPPVGLDPGLLEQPEVLGRPNRRENQVAGQLADVIQRHMELAVLL